MSEPDRILQRARPGQLIGAKLFAAVVDQEARNRTMRWTIEDNTNATGGFLRILKDGKRVSDVFPFARESDPEFVRAEAQRIVDQMNAVDAINQSSPATTETKA